MRFVLVHGGFHAAWCWEQTIDELRRVGHDGVAVDLPGHGARVDEESTLANRRDAGDVLEGEFDADAGEMLAYLKFDDDGAMWFADFDGAWKYFYHDCEEESALGLRAPGSGAVRRHHRDTGFRTEFLGSRSSA
jgi:hypothetical protein